MDVSNRGNLNSRNNHEMKNIFVILSLFVSCLSVSYAQNNNYCFVYNMNEYIPLYQNSDDSIASSSLYQDTLKENYYSLQIIDCKKDRFKVRIIDENDINTTGWIDKEYCFVWCWLMSSNSIYLFPEPDMVNSYTEISEDDMSCNRGGYVANIIEFDNKSNWIKISLTTKTSAYTGWTLNYCNNIYGSCEGWKSTPPSQIY